MSKIDNMTKESKNNNHLSRQETTPIKLKELKDLYVTYLNELCPDWSEERIEAEIQNVFKEQGLDKSRRRREEFRDRLLQKLDEIRHSPKEWLFGPNGG